MAYRALRENNELRFEFFLAHELKKDVEEIREMPNETFVYWAMYFAQIAQDKQAAGGR